MGAQVGITLDVDKGSLTLRVHAGEGHDLSGRTLIKHERAQSNRCRRSVAE